MKVFLDAGHGGKDPGALGNSLREKDINLSVALKVGEILKRYNIDVLYSRTTDIFIELSERATMANKANADIFISIHCNADESVNAKGVETYSYPSSSKGTTLAKYIQDSILQNKVYTLDRGIKIANFAVLRQSIMPSALIELGFITNIEDCKILRSKQDELALAISKGVLNNLGIKETIDVESYSVWAKEAMEWAIKLGLTDGTSPKEPITLERFITVLHRYNKTLE
ncbi:N-acetylmuramoyl-L-alanine amidase [Tissierella sp.]|uniref:N-acetylmuramoyl-L-alanine amidase family protein n=1 Tax=Tissierella sp. TaxID=41274 RepID=UPI0030520EB8